MSDKELAKKILELVGGEENIAHLTNCVTRLRFNLKDNDKANTKELKNLDGVLGSQLQGDQYQVVIGPRVDAIAFELHKILKDIPKNEKIKSTGKKKNVFGSMVEVLAAILSPILPAIIGGGMLKGFIFMFINFGWISGTSDTVFILGIIADGMFYFLPFLLAVSAAKKFDTNEYLALSVAGAMMYPTFVELFKLKERTFVNFLGFIPIKLQNYGASVLPIILSVLLLKYVYDFFKKKVPQMVNIIFAPLFTLLIVIPLSLSVIAPIGYFIGVYIAVGIENLTSLAPWLAGFVVGATRPILVVSGMHHALNPITQEQLRVNGYSSMSAMTLMSTIAQATTALGVYIFAKKGKTKQIALSSAISGYIGITEPVLYGILVKYKWAMFAGCMGGGIGAAVGAMLGARGYEFVMPGIITIPAYMGKGSTTGLFIGIGVTIVTTLFLLFVQMKKIRNIDEEGE